MRRLEIVEKKKFRINQFIRASEIRLIDSSGLMVGVIKTADALKKSQNEKLDLVEISPHAVPPVCKIVNFSKFKYEIEKKNREEKKKQKVSHVKEIRIRPRISEHDLCVKILRARKFINNEDKVQITIIFSGREMQHKDLGIKIIDRIRNSLIDIATSESRVSTVGNRILLIFLPNKKRN
ncbi:MAG: translation initiation factor IF-3 [Endomicrobium sp.]|nr:translation initiation factor IF-3 [Endomicrobium sp.]